MNVDTQKFASKLVAEHGVDGAITLATEAALRCLEERDLYNASLWREIRSSLRLRKQQADWSRRSLTAD